MQQKLTFCNKPASIIQGKIKDNLFFDHPSILKIKAKNEEEKENLEM